MIEVDVLANGTGRRQTRAAITQPATSYSDIESLAVLPGGSAAMALARDVEQVLTPIEIDLTAPGFTPRPIPLFCSGSEPLEVVGSSSGTIILNNGYELLELDGQGDWNPLIWSSVGNGAGFAATSLTFDSLRRRIVVGTPGGLTALDPATGAIPCMAR